MNILGIESSCDETAASVIKDGREIISNGDNIITYLIFWDNKRLNGTPFSLLAYARKY